MPDQYEYVDENGDPVDPSEIGDDVEIVEEVIEEIPAAVAPQAPAPAAQPPAAGSVTGETVAAPARRVPKVAVAVAAAVVLAVGGGVAYGLHSIGSQSTVADVKTKVTDKTNALKTTATAKRDEIEHPPIDVCNDLAKAQVDKTVSIPSSASMRLRVIHSAPLPSQVATSLKTDPAKLQLLQLSANSWGLYLPQPQQTTGAVDDFSPHTATKQTWWKIPVDTADNGLKVGTVASWPGGDQDASGACPSGKAGTYAVVGAVPADAAGLRKDQVDVVAIKGDASSATETTGTAATTTTTAAPQDDSANRVVAVMGSSVVVAALEYVPEQTAPATTTEGR
ncbi:hypothetical protein GCM10027169_00200 [Gordonia jinhuaensis]|uniref:Uncharacterized protein n=1 Tax=Gordonia jinhuaensis TaxID=1517702 RepID=A0A916SX52_9ACTN|nr:hypothetical protein [Gordonia jinhuaensis]GGB18215.1 hypothetical protein GCM10011489_02860 [Gordonia jinhuaensis]